MFSKNNSTAFKSYSYVDKAPISGTNYYRLKQVDADGSFTYSSIVAVNHNGGSDYSIYPSIVKSELTIDNLPVEREGKVPVEIINQSGYIVKTFSLDDFQKRQTIDLSDIPTGSYLLKLNGSISKFIKL